MEPSSIWIIEGGHFLSNVRTIIVGKGIIFRFTKTVCAVVLLSEFYA
jgi:hypothetical protein